MLTNTGAGGGNYVSLAFDNSLQSWGGSAVSGELSSKEEGALLAANLASSGVPGMSILGFTVLSIVLTSEDRVRNI